MKKIENMYEMVALLMMFDEDSTARSFVGNEFEVLELLGAFNECVDIAPDLIQFNSEEEGYYVFTVDRIESNLVYSILPALNEKVGKFYGINGDVFVSSMVPETFEKDIKTYKYISVDSVTRVSIWDTDTDDETNDCNENCGNCPLKSKDDNLNIITEKNDNNIVQTWTDGKGNYFSRSYYSSDKDTMNKVMHEWEDFAKRLK